MLRWHAIRFAAGMDILRQDLLYALRRLRQAPGFSLVAIATLALGIGANSAIFSVVNGVLLKPLPFEEPDRLVRLSQTWEGRTTGIYSPQNFLDVVASARDFESLAAIDGGGVTLTGRGAPARLEGAEVSTSFFDVLRVRPVLGRGFVDGENEPDRNNVAILGHRLWRERFGADPAAVGQTIQLNREPYLVVGVAPAGFLLSGRRRAVDADRVRRALPHEEPGGVVPRRDRTTEARGERRPRTRGSQHHRRSSGV